MTAKLLKNIVYSLFPKNCGLVSAFGYGSVAVPQYGRTVKNSQLDLILVVDDPLRWHMANLQMNPNHYSSIASLNSGQLLKKIISKWPHPAVYYNPFVTWHDPTNASPSLIIKYGVIGYQNLISDLNTWCSLYISGRLHKPVVFVPQYEPSSELKSSFIRNLKSALAFSLLQLDLPLLKEDILYYSIASISYNGDWRLYFGEDKRKIERLITGEPRRRGFRELYLPLFSSEPFYSLFTVEVPDDLKADMRIFPRHEDQIVRQLLDYIPSSLCQLAIPEDPVSARQKLAEMTIEERRRRLLTTAASIVRWTSYRQTLLGLFSAGFLRSFLYSSSKFRKMLASLRS